MRWSYKTVHYDYKKEGLLGGAFLDEAEIEESMNEFGRAGWELVSLLEVQEGLIATFKQPIDVPALQNEQKENEKKEEMKDAPPRFLRPERLQKDSVSRQELQEEVIQPYGSKQNKAVKKRSSGGEDDNGGAGAIRIE